MLDIQSIRTSPEYFRDKLGQRSAATAMVVDEILVLDKKHREAITNKQSAEVLRNKNSKLIGKAKASKDEARAEELYREVLAAKEQISQQSELEEKYHASLQQLLLTTPNIALDDVPIGADEEDNREEHQFGAVREFSFSPVSHDELGVNLKTSSGEPQLDFETAANMSGARFSILRGDLARLERAVAALMIDSHLNDNSYELISPPLMTNDKAMIGTDKLPKFADDLFQTTDGRWLIPTAEVTLTAQVMDKILEADKLPLRYVADTPCFRSEAGASGQDTRGMIRQHQFRKIELVSIVAGEEAGIEELERKTRCAEKILESLELPYRRLTLCTGDMGFGGRKTYDLEVWIPSQERYREISSCSYCGDFQARRMNARYRPQAGAKTQYVHTLNGSGLAVGRTLVAIMENYQNADGGITIPEALVPYMGGQKVIEKA